MGKRVTFSGDNLTINDIWSWYEISMLSIRGYKNSILSSITKNQAVPQYFIGLTIGELNDFFDDYCEELDHLVSFDLLSSVEATLKIEYLQRSNKKDKDPISLKFRNLYKKRGAHVSLKDDLLTIWLEKGLSVSNIIGDLKGALNFRDWLAHGRFWTPKFGRKYDTFTVFFIAQGVLSKLPLKYSK